MALPSVRRLSALLGTSSSHEALCAGAQIYVNFLSLTRRSGFLQGHISKQTDESPEEAARARNALEIAAERHLAFMELRKELPTAVPTRDISVVWHSDLLRPTVGMIRQHEEAEEAATAWFDHQQHRLLQSGATFEKATGRRWSVAHALWQGGAWGLIGAGLFKHPGAAVAGAVAGAASSYDYESGAKVVGAALKRFDPDASGIVTAQERAEALAAWQRQYDVTAARWRDNEATEYRVPPGQMALVGPRRLTGVAEQQRREALATELADAVASQASFTGRILALGPKVINDEWIGRAVTRYGHFLALARAHPGEMLVPTLDVDLIWCVHLRPPTPWQALTRAADAITLTIPSAPSLSAGTCTCSRLSTTATIARSCSAGCSHTTRSWARPSSPTHSSGPSRCGTLRAASRMSTGRRPMHGAKAPGATPGAARADGAMLTSMRSWATHRRRPRRSHARTAEEEAATNPRVPRKVPRRVPRRVPRGVPRGVPRRGQTRATRAFGKKGRGTMPNPRR